jgi:hypothetical protein
MRAEAHLHIGKARKGEQACISLRKLPNYQVEYAGTVVLSDVTFAVQAAGLRRFRESGQKNVHAYVRGTLVDTNMEQEPAPYRFPWREAYYNPTKTDTFVDKTTGQPLTSARAAWMRGGRVHYLP